MCLILGKTAMQIANECNVTYEIVHSVAQRHEIKGQIRKENNKRYFDKYQEELIHQMLYFEGKSTEIILESKINGKFDIN